MERAGQAYIAKHGRNRDKANEVAAMQTLVANVARERAMLNKLETDKKTTQEEKALNLRDAILLQRAGGIQFAKPTLLSDQNLDRAKCRHLGSGGINQVQKMVYQPPGQGKQVRVFKAEDPNARVPGGPLEIGIVPAIPDSRAAMSPPGNLPKAWDFRTSCRTWTWSRWMEYRVSPWSALPASRWRRMRSKRWLAAPPTTTFARTTCARTRQRGGLWTSPANPMDLEGDAQIETQYLKAMVNLQWLDAISGQIDRHERNYLIEIKNGVLTIKAIDNDFSFGDKHTSVEGIEGAGTQQSRAAILRPARVIDGAFYAHFAKLSLKVALGAGADALTEGERKATDSGSRKRKSARTGLPRPAAWSTSGTSSRRTA